MSWSNPGDDCLFLSHDPHLPQPSCALSDLVLNSALQSGSIGAKLQLRAAAIVASRGMQLLSSHHGTQC